MSICLLVLISRRFVEGVNVRVEKELHMKEMRIYTAICGSYKNKLG